VSAVLTHRLEMAGACDLALDADLMHWLAEDVGMGQTDRWLRHSCRLVGCMTGALRLVDDLFPNAAIAFQMKGRGAAFSALVIPVGAPAPFAGLAPCAANAVLAASLRAFAHASARQDGFEMMRAAG